MLRDALYDTVLASCITPLEEDQYPEIVPDKVPPQPHEFDLEVARRILVAF